MKSCKPGLAAAFVTLLAAGCHSTAVTDACASQAGHTCISVEVLSPASMALQVDQLEVMATAGFQITPGNDVRSPEPAGAATKLPVVIGVLPGDVFGGAFTLRVQGRLAGTVVGAGTIDGAVAAGQHIKLTVTLAPGGGPAPDPAKSTVTVDRTAGVLANGSDAAIVTVTLLDSGGTPLAGQVVTLATTGLTGALLGMPVLTDNAGTTTASLTSMAAGVAMLSATAGGVTLSQMPTVAFVPAATKLVFTAPPHDANVDANLTPAVQVTLEDAGGNPVDASTPITLTIATNAGNGTLSGSVVAIPSAGVVSFADLSIDTAGMGYTLSATGGGLTSAPSSAFNVFALPWQAASSGLFGGSVQSVVYDPTDSQRAYALTQVGVFSSINGGGTWHPAYTGLPKSGAHSYTGLGIDAHAPGTLYVSDFKTGSMYKTTNGGALWKAAAPLPASVALYHFTVDPNNSNLYAVGGDGVAYRSVDGATSWQAAVAADPNASLIAVGGGTTPPVYLVASNGAVVINKSTDGGANYVHVGALPAGANPTTLLVDPVDGQTLYLSSFGGSGIYKSTSSGSSWVMSATGIPSNPRCFGLSLVPGATASTTTLYAVCEESVYVSTDSAGSWQLANTGLDSPRVTEFSLAVDPKNPMNALLGSLGAGVWKTGNAGQAWTSTIGMTAAEVSRIIYTSNGMFASVKGGGVYVSNDLGGTWTAINKGLPRYDVSALAVDGSNRPFCAVGNQGYTGNGVFSYNQFSGLWVTLGTTGNPPNIPVALAVDAGDAMHVVAGNFNGNNFYTTMGGTPWSYTAGSCIMSSLFFDPASSTKAYANCSENDGAMGVVYSSDGGANFSNVNTGLPGGGVRISSLMLAQDGVTLYAGGTTGGAYTSPTSTINWVARNTGLPTNEVRALAGDPSSPSKLWAATDGGGVYYTLNGGAGWSSLSSGIRFPNTSAIAVDTAAPSTVFVGTIGGIFRTTTGGN